MAGQCSILNGGASGSICLDKTNVLCIVALVLIILYVANKELYSKLYDRINDLEGAREMNTKIEQQILVKQSSDSQGVDSNAEYIDRDRVAINDRLYPPFMRNYHSDETGMVKMEPGAKGLPINVETRGSGGDFQQIGILYKDSVADDEKVPGNNTDSNVLPLYGKPTYKGSNRWIYYTSTDKFQPIKIPIAVNGTDCTDDRGCDEISNGQSITVPSYNGSFKVKIYQFDKPRYIPYV
jgi:hypothetical protein